MRFSQREGIKPVKSVIQVDSMDSDLRTGLWNALEIYYLTKIKGRYVSSEEKIFSLLKGLWIDHFKWRIGTLTNDGSSIYRQINEYFSSCEWYEVYDLLDFIAQNCPNELEKVNKDFMEYCNSVLERELSAYRFVGEKIASLTSKEEIAEIEEALKIVEPLKNVRMHLERALELLADRRLPDYRNSIKESISAVEAICILITKDPKATLGQAVKKLEPGVKVHPALENAFSKLYGYSSSADGIRHALLDEPNLELEDAKFMLVSCSTFVNYLMAKVSRAGIKL
jgi:hypothetical protein